MNKSDERTLIERRPQCNADAMAAALADFLRAAGLDEAADGEAPAKAAAAWAEELLSGYAADPQQILGKTWPDRTGEMVTVRSVPFVSVCAHHLLPFYGRVHLAYLPDGRLAGLSRLTALVDCLGRRLQVQERLTEELCEALMDGLGARGAACVLEASHDCVGARKLEHRGAQVQTVAYSGEFANDSALQATFLQLIYGEVRNE